MAEIGSAFLSILPSAKGFGSKLESEVSGETRGAGKKAGAGFGTAFKVGAAAVIGGGLLAANFLKGAVSDAREAQKVAAATTAIIKATGGAANVTAGQVANLSDALAKKTGVDDGQIAAGANLLLTFKNVKKEGEGLDDVFKRATVAGLDLAAAGFGSVEGNALQLGKALNDPIKGISALGRAGVTFTDVQKEQIKGFVASNDLLSAQKIILGEVEAQVGGTAAATATAGEKAAYAYGELKESIGTALLPVIDSLQNAFVRLAPAIQSAIDGIGPAFRQAVAFVRPFAEAVGGQLVRNFNALKSVFDFLQPTFDKIGGFFRENPAVVKAFAVTLVGLVGAIGAVTLATTLFSIALNSTGIPLLIIGVAALVAGLVYAYQTSDTFRAAVQNVATTVQTVVLPALQSMWAYFQANVVPVLQQVAGVVRDQVLPIIGRFAEFVTGTLIPAVIRIATAIGSNLAPIFKQLVATFQADVLPVLQKLLAKFNEYQPTIQKVIAVVVQVIGKVLEFAAAVLGKVLPPVIRFAGYLISTLVPAIGNVIEIAVRIIAKVAEIGQAFVDGVKDVAKFATGVKEKIEDVLDKVRAIPGKVTTAIGNLGTLLYNAGSELIQGLINGITSKISALGTKLSEVGDKIKGFLPGSPVKEGPLKSWNDGKGGVSAAGQRLMDGVTQGLGMGIPALLARIKEISGRLLGLADKKLRDKLKDQLEDLVDKFKDATDKVLDGLKSKRDAIKGVLDGFKNDFASLRDSIASTFTGNLFEGATSASFVENLLGKRGSLQELKAAFTKLRGYGLDPAFLSQLFASGNGALILDLASEGKGSALGAQALFNETNSLANSLGSQVAKADIGPDIRRQTEKLEEIRKEIKQQAKEFARELNAVASRAQRSAA